MNAGAAATPRVPLVSVIVPAYNYGRFIGQTLESLRAQTLARWECVVVDDGSTDDTARVVEEFTSRDARIKLLRQQNRRQAAARNNGLRNSVAPFIQFLDADDLIEPRKLEQQAAYLESHPEVDIIYGDARVFPTEAPDMRLYTMYGEDKPWQPGLSGRGRKMLLPLLRHNSVMIGATLTRRSLIERVGPFDEVLPAIEDWEYWLRCAAAGASFRFEVFEDSLSLIRSHPESWSKNDLRNARAEVLMREKLKAVLEDPEARRLNDQLLAEAEGTLGAAEVMAGNRSHGLRHLTRALRQDRNPRHKLKWLACALAAPLSGGLFQKIYSSSFTQTASTALRRLRRR